MVKNVVSYSDEAVFCSVGEDTFGSWVADPSY